MNARRTRFAVTKQVPREHLDITSARHFSVRGAVAAARRLSADDAEAIVKVWRGENLLAQFHRGVGITAVCDARLLDRRADRMAER